MACLLEATGSNITFIVHWQVCSSLWDVIATFEIWFRQHIIYNNNNEQVIRMDLFNLDYFLITLCFTTAHNKSSYGWPSCIICSRKYCWPCVFFSLFASVSIGPSMTQFPYIFFQGGASVQEAFQVHIFASDHKYKGVSFLSSLS